MNRIIFIIEEISSEGGQDSLVRRVTEQLLFLESRSKEPIHVFIDTGGGNVQTALCLFELFKICRSPIYTYGLSEVSSAGILLFLAGSKRFSLKYTQFMSHPSILSMTASSEDFEATSESLLIQGSQVKQIFKSTLKISDKKFKDLHSSTHYIWPKEALKLKIVTSIIDKLPIVVIEESSQFSEKDMEYIEKATSFYKESKKHLLAADY